MIGVLSIVALGFFLGMRHATDPDHVIAVTTIVTRERSMKLAAWIGALWGIGHTVTIALVGSAIIGFNLVIPPRLGLTMELAVGVMLIALGTLNVIGTNRPAVLAVARVPDVPPVAGAPHPHPHAHAPTHTHAHSHGDYVHTHPHEHVPERHPHAPDATPLARLDRTFSRLRPYQIARPLVVGVVHGLAGSAAVALLVLTTIHQPFWAFMYLCVFGLGTVAGMVLITTAIAAPIVWTGARVASASRRLQVATGLLSLAFGLVLAWKIGVLDGLFGASPAWTPK
jgi:High-affinity nickel-transport protein